jgi:hypothetical protein
MVTSDNLDSARSGLSKLAPVTVAAAGFSFAGVAVMGCTLWADVYFFNTDPGSPAVSYTGAGPRICKLTQQFDKSLRVGPNYGSSMCISGPY